MNKRPTIQMVADLAGVSRGTVDRVINNRTKVSEDVRLRVLQAIEDVGYLTPRDFYNTKLHSPQLKAIKLGILLPNWTGHFRNEILRGTQAAIAEFEELNVEIIIAECNTDLPQETIEKIDQLLLQKIDGLAICTLDTPLVKRKVAELAEKNIPVVTYNSDLTDSKRLLFVGQDDKQSGRIAAQIINKMNPHNEILVAVGNLEFKGHKTRLEGFQERMAELSFSRDKLHIIETYNNYQLTYQKIYDFLQKNNQIKMVYMVNRSVSACTEAIKDLGKKGSVHLVCHDLAEHTKELLRTDAIDFTISQDLFNQSYLSLVHLREFLQKNRAFDFEKYNTAISIICSENI